MNYNKNKEFKEDYPVIAIDNTSINVAKRPVDEIKGK